jgi:5-methyltetrahydropteroyltriglutamate--homocysteine methyltransferase
MNRSTDRILTTHAGSLVRTLEIIELMKARTLGKPVTDEEFQETVASGVADVVRRQVEAGVDIPNDGEYGRRDFRVYIGERIEGLERVQLKPGETNPFDSFRGPKGEWDQFPSFYAQYYASAQFAWQPPEVDMSEIAALRSKRGFNSGVVHRLVGPLRYNDTAVQRDIAQMRAALDGLEVADAFISAVTPTNMTRQDINILDFYPSLEAYQYALADVMREEYKAITEAGFILQLDRPAQDPTYQLEDEQEIAKALDAAIEIENYALRDIPVERTRLHWCGGSSNRPHLNNIPMGKVAKSMLKLNVGAYGFEAANPRHEHEFRIWEDIKLPEGKVIVPGLISQSTNVVEHPELVAWRIKNFTDLVGRENVIAGVDCGFSQGWDHPRTHADVQWAKLRALAEGAAIATAELWKTPASATAAS